MSEADRKTILIVDDEVKMANAACALLNDAGYEASSAASAKEALALLLEYPAHMVIADLHMPDVDGVALLKGVREIDANIIRMIITEQPGPEATKALAEADIQQVVAKPWDDAELTEIVRSAFEQTASQEMEMQGLHRIISEIDSLPPVPSVYAELSQITQDAENASADEVTRIINQDPGHRRKDSTDRQFGLLRSTARSGYREQCGRRPRHGNGGEPGARHQCLSNVRVRR